MNFVSQVDDLVFQDFRYWNRYRLHPGVSNKELQNANAQAMKAVLSAETVLACVERDGQKGVVGIRPLPWDSAHFGMPMASLAALANPEADSHRLAVLLRNTVRSHFRKTGCRHYSIEVDVDDYTVLNACTQAGFEVMDFKRTYFTNRLNRESSYTKLNAGVRAYRAEDREAVLNLADQVLFDTRYTRDRYLDGSHSQVLYRKWFEKLIDDYPHAANVLVCERGGEVVACGAIGEKDLSALGINRKIRSGSIYASTKSGQGAYGPVLYRLTSEALETHGLVETTVSLNSTVATRVVEGVRPNKSLTHCCLRLFLADAS